MGLTYVVLLQEMSRSYAKLVRSISMDSPHYCKFLYLDWFDFLSHYDIVQMQSSYFDDKLVNN